MSGVVVNLDDFQRVKHLLNPNRRRSIDSTAPSQLVTEECRAKLPALLPIVKDTLEPQERPAIRKLEVRVSKPPKNLYSPLSEMSFYVLEYDITTRDTRHTDTVRVYTTSEVARLLWSARRSVEPGGSFQTYNLTDVPDGIFNHRGESPWVS